MPMTETDPMYVLPAAVEAAQRTASEIVADAIRAAEAAGYERGLREGDKLRAEAIRAAETAGYERGTREAFFKVLQAQAPAPIDKLRALLTRASEILGEAEESTNGIDGYCDDLTVRTKRGGDSITVPDSDDSFEDVSQFLSDYGGKDVVDVDDVEIDAEDVRQASQETLAAMHRLSGVLSEIRALMGIKDADEESEGDGGPTEKG